MSTVLENVEIRPMGLEDLPWCAVAEAEVEETPWTLANFKDALKTGWPARVLTVDGVLAGWAVLMPALDERELLIIGVARAWQRRGLGRTLLNALVAECRRDGVSRIHLEVRESNAPARALYASTGFEVAGRRRGYYKLGEGREDAVLMTLELHPGEDVR